MIDLVPSPKYQTAPIGRLFQVVLGGTPNADAENWGDDVVWVTPSDLSRVRGGVTNDSQRKLSASGLKAASQLVPAGSLVLSTRAPVGYAAIAGVDLATNQGCKALVPGPSVNPRFYLYVLQASGPSLDVLSNGTTFRELGTPQLAGARVPFPPRSIQDSVVAFLDEEIDSMDLLLQEIETQQVLLDERDRVAVKRLVTGLDIPGPRTTDGPWWLGSTPASWTPQKISRNFLTGSGTTPKSGDSRYYGGPHFWLNTAECRDGIVTETTKTVTDEALAEYSSLKFYPVGSLVVAMYGATIGKLAVLGSEMTVNQACVVLHHPRELDTQFVYWWLWAHRAELITLGEGGGQPNISQEVIRQLVVPAPSLEVQRGIVDKIVEMRQWSQRMRDESDRQATLLAERRQAVITAAVTGQMEVA